MLNGSCKAIFDIYTSRPFQPLQSSSKFSSVLEDSKFLLLGMWVSSSHLLQSGVATRLVRTILPTLQNEGYNQCLNKIWNWRHAKILFKLRIPITMLFIFHKNILFIPISSMIIPTKTKPIFNNRNNGHNL